MKKQTESRKVRICIANPAGNITIFVLDPFPRSQYQTVAGQLLAMEALHGEQVAFITGPDSMEMCGLEFCGNASRSFALLKAKKEGLTGHGIMDISVSGCSQRLQVVVDTSNNYTKIKMPLPRNVAAPDAMETAGTDTLCSLMEGARIVDMDGIMHVVVRDKAPTRENFEVIKGYINDRYDPPAMGVMFYDTASGRLTPVVYVKDVDTTYFEGSCGSGSTAVAAAFCQEERTGTFSFTLPQPAGTITATCEKAHGSLKAVYIEGPVQLDAVRQVEILL